MRTLACVLAAAGVLAAQTSGVVEGRIVSSATGQPIKRATVILTGIPSTLNPVAENYACLSDANGRFTVNDVLPGAYEASALRSGYQDHAAGGPQLVKVPAGQRVTGIEVRLIPVGTIAGKIVDENGEPVRNARIAAMRYKYNTGRAELFSEHETATNDRGEYRITVSARNWYLRVSKDDHEPPLMGDLVNRGPARERVFPVLYFPGTSDPLHAVHLDVAPGAEVPHADMVLRREMVYSIRFKVPPGTNPRIVRNTSTMFSWAGRDLGAGVQEISGLAPGTYTLMADRNDRNSRRNMPFAMQRVEISNQDLDGIDLTRSTALEIAGKLTVTGESAPSLDTLKVALKTDQPGTQATYLFSVNADGSFTLNAHPDPYYLDISGPTGVYLKSMRIGDREVPDHRLMAGRDTGKLTLVASLEKGRVEGFVEDAQGSPVVRRLVTLVPDQTLPYWIDLYKSMKTDTSGRFLITDVVPGDYRMFAWVDNDAEPPMDPDFRKPFDVQSVKVRVMENSSAAAKLVVIGR